MFQNLLFTMSLSGTMVFIFYILLYPLTKRWVSLRWRYGMLKIAMIFYLVPFPEGKYLMIQVIERTYPTLWKRIPKMSVAVDPKYMFVVNNNWIHVLPKAKLMLLMLLVSGTISLVVIGKYVVRYRKMKRIYLSFREEQRETKGQELFIKWKRKMGIRKKILFVSSEYCSSPMTCGQWSPVILFPCVEETKLDIEDYHFLIRHELIHILHQDLLVKYLGLLVIAVHWFNPFSYLLFHDISCISEMYCDEKVLEGEDEEMRRRYGELLLKLATENVFENTERFFAGVANSRNKKIYKRRILEMRTNRKCKVILSMVTMALVCMMGGITCFAYNSPTIALNDYAHDLDESFSFTTGAAKVSANPYLCNNFFTDKEGNVYDLSEGGRALCIHDFSVYGTSQTHKLDGKGGCVVKSYDSVKCKYCNTIKVGELISTTTYTKCPH